MVAALANGTWQLFIRDTACVDDGSLSAVKPQVPTPTNNESNTSSTIEKRA
ncbi:hypothetical protein LBMAG48_25500 [Phycisphaerae bacterium]|nr:hypothetical protein LBMAG48_25500 [Phycisphaerae bacterium]